MLGSGQRVLTAGPQSAHELQRRAISGSLWTALHAGLSAPLAFAANAVVARFLGVADYGRLAFLTLALGFAVQMTNLSFSAGAIQWGAAAEARGDRLAADSFLRRSLGFHVLVQLPFLVLAVLLLAREQPWWIRGALLASVVIPAILSSTTLSLTIENKTAGAAKIAIASNAVVQAAVALSAVLSGTAAGVWATRSVAASVLLPLNFMLLDRARRRVSMRMSLPKDMPDGFWRFCTYASLAGLVGTLVFSRSEVLLLAWLTTPEAVGLFALAYGVSAQITAPVDAVVGPLVPAVAGLLSSHSASAKPALLRAVRLAALLAGGVTAVALPLFFFAIPLIYGNEFTAAAPLFLVLGAASCFQSICNPVVVFTQGRRRTDVILKMSSIALVVNVAIALALIPLLGVWGAAVANATALATFFCLALRHELRVHGIGAAELAAASGSWLVALASAALAVLLSSILPLGAALASALAGCVGAAGYVLGLWVTGSGLTEQDAGAITAAVPSSMQRPMRWLVRMLSRRRR